VGHGSHVQICMFTWQRAVRIRGASSFTKAKRNDTLRGSRGQQKIILLLVARYSSLKQALHLPHTRSGISLLAPATQHTFHKAKLTDEQKWLLLLLL